MISKELKTRLDTFIDAILAIIITIMVLELPAQSWEHHANITNFFWQLGCMLSVSVSWRIFGTSKQLCSAPLIRFHDESCFGNSSWFSYCHWCQH